MKFPRVKTTTKLAFELYHTLPYFLSTDIKKMFKCSDATASRIKHLCLDEMQKRDIKMYCEKGELINKDVLMDLAGLNIKQIDKDYAALLKCNLIGGGSDEAGGK